MVAPFGVLADGRVVHAITLGSPDFLQAQVLTYAGNFLELTLLPGASPSLRCRRSISMPMSGILHSSCTGRRARR